MSKTVIKNNRGDILVLEEKGVVQICKGEKLNPGEIAAITWSIGEVDHLNDATLIKTRKMNRPVSIMINDVPVWSDSWQSVMTRLPSGRSCKVAEWNDLDNAITIERLED